MSGKSIWLLFISLLILRTLCAQDPKQSDPVRIFANGPVPDLFLPVHTLNEIYNPSGGSSPGRELSGKETDDFLASVNYATDGIVKSGRLLYDDTISRFLGNILNILLAEHPEIRSRINVYAHKSTVVNAFMLPNGMLFVNLGLIANATCEADIAFILAHEIVHYTRQHSINLHIEGLSKEWSEEQFIFDYLAYHHRSRIQEAEADEAGLREYFLRTDYNHEAVYRAFEIMQFGHLPFEEMPLMREEVETEFYRFPEKYYADNVKSISNKSIATDTLSTHPAIPERIRKVREILEKSQGDGGNRFIAPEQDFIYIRDLARYECICQDLIDGKYTEAFYNSRVMLENHPGSHNIEIARVAALYGLAKIKRAGMSSKIPPEKDTEGAMHTVVRFIRRASARDASLLALRYAWNTKKKYPDDRYLEQVCNDLLTDIGSQLKLGLEDFSDFGMNDLHNLPVPDSAQAITSKYDAGKAKALVTPEKDWETYRFMLADLKKEPAFILAFNEAGRQYQLAQIEQMTRRKPTGKTLRASTPIVYFLEPNLVLEKGLGYRSKEKSLSKLPGGANASHSLVSCSKAAGITPLMLNATGGTPGEEYRRYTAAREMTREIIEKSATKVVSWTAFNLIDTNAFGIEYLAVYNQRSTRGKSPTSEMLPFTILSVFQYPLLPIGLYNFLVPSCKTSASFYLMDFRSGKLVHSDQDSFEEKPRGDYLKQFIYKSLRDSKAEILSIK